ncbi:MAG: type II CAAX endopeptidase family protein, partial [Chloroflexota bacterium]|nr:type II CAAX endopeptidase family protein [Chloroflexota bacterium]
MTNWKSLRWYLLISFGLAWVLFLIPLAIGELGSRTRQIALTIFWAIAMWAPGLAAILTTRLIDREPRGILNLRRLGPKRFYLWAWLAPIGLAIFTGLLTWAFGIGQFDPEFTLIRAVLAQAPNTPDISPALIVAGQSLFALTLAPLFNTLFALGEELGWRGFLLPRLLPMGQWRAILLSGIIWGLWHAPVILQGHNYPTRPVRGVFMMIVFTVLCGAFFSWLYLETRSPWAPALAHGALNASAGLPLLFLKGV